MSCRLEKVLLVLKCCKIGRFCNIPSFGRTAANFKYFLMREKPGKSWDVLFSNSEKNIFSSACKIFVWKNNSKFCPKMAKIQKHVFGSKMVKNDFFLHESGFIRKFREFWILLLLGIFFIRLLVFAVEALEICYAHFDAFWGPNIKIYKN